jgi:hypothetical protein
MGVELWRGIPIDRAGSVGLEFRGEELARRLCGMVAADYSPVKTWVMGFAYFSCLGRSKPDMTANR